MIASEPDRRYLFHAVSLHLSIRLYEPHSRASIVQDSFFALSGISSTLSRRVCKNAEIKRKAACVERLSANSTHVLFPSCFCSHRDQPRAHAESQRTQRQDAVRGRMVSRQKQTNTKDVFRVIRVSSKGNTMAKPLQERVLCGALSVYIRGCNILDRVSPNKRCVQSKDGPVRSYNHFSRRFSSAVIVDVSMFVQGFPGL